MKYEAVSNPKTNNPAAYSQAQSNRIPFTGPSLGSLIAFQIISHSHLRYLGTPQNLQQLFPWRRSLAHTTARQTALGGQFKSNSNSNYQLPSPASVKPRHVTLSRSLIIPYSIPVLSVKYLFDIKYKYRFAPNRKPTASPCRFSFNPFPVHTVTKPS